MSNKLLTQIEEADVPYEGRDKDAHALQIALNIAGYNFHYALVELIKNLGVHVYVTDGKTTIKDVAKIKADWETKWKKIIEDQTQK